MEVWDPTLLVGLIYNKRLIALVNELLKKATKTHTKVRKA